MRTFLFGFALLVSTLIFPNTSHAQGYVCWDEHERLSGRQILPGRCFQKPMAGNPVPRDVRIASYVRCEVYKGGNDEYPGSCCGHLSSADANYLKVCEGKRTPAQGLELAIQIGTILNELPLLCQVFDCGYMVEW